MRKSDGESRTTTTTSQLQGEFKYKMPALNDKQNRRNEWMWEKVEEK